MKLVIRRNKLVAMLLALTAITSLCAENNAPVMFNRVMNVMQDEVIRKTANTNQSNSRLLDMFHADGMNCRGDFDQIVTLFDTGALNEQKMVQKAYKDLLKRVLSINKALKKPGDIRYCYVRYLKNDIDALTKQVDSVEKSLQYSQDRQAAYVVKRFSNLMNKSIFPLLCTYIGTPLERQVIDRFIRRPFEFYKRNWWWTVPLTIAAGVVGHNIWTYKLPDKNDPATWNFNTVTTPTDNRNWYRKLIGLAAGLLPFGLAVKASGGDGLINAGTTMAPFYVSEPIGMIDESQQVAVIRSINDRMQNNDLVHHQRVLTNMPRRIIRQIPQLVQAGLQCGWYALYNAWCFLRHLDNHEDVEAQRLFNNRARFNEKKTEWRNFLLNAQQNGNPFLPPQRDNFAENLEQGAMYFLFRNHPEFMVNQNRLSIIAKQELDNGLIPIPNTNDFGMNRNNAFVQLGGADHQPAELGQNIARVRFGGESHIVILLTPGHWKTFLVGTENDVPSVTVIDSNKSNKHLDNDYINNWLLHLFFVQQIDGLEDLGRQLQLID